MKSKKAVEMTVSLVVKMIIGIVLFGMGFALFAQITSQGEDFTNEMNEQIKNEIASLECSNDEGWICSPSYRLQPSKSKTFWIYITNKADVTGTYRIEFDSLDSISGGKQGISNTCGDLIIYAPDIGVQIESGSSAAFPFKAVTSRIRESSCSFTGVVKVDAMGGTTEGDGEATPVIIRVE